MPAGVWYALVIVSDRWNIGLRGLAFADGPGSVVTFDVAGSVFVPVGAIAAGCRVVSSLRATEWAPPASLSGASCSLGRGQGCWCWKALYAASISFGPGIVRPAFVMCEGMPAGCGALAIADRRGTERGELRIGP